MDAHWRGQRYWAILTKIKCYAIMARGNGATWDFTSLQVGAEETDLLGGKCQANPFLLKYG